MAGVTQDIEDLAAVLARLGAKVDGAGRPGPDVLLVRPGPGAPAVAIRVRGRALADPGRVAALVAEAAGRVGPATVLVADQVPDRSRDLLREAGWGWLDRRGHLRVHAPGLLIDTAVPGRPRPRLTARPPVSGRGGVTWAAALLLDPGRAPVLRAVSRETGLAPSTLAAAAAAVREAQLVDRRGRARLPELFWAVADAWRPAWTALAARPPAGPDREGHVMTGGVVAGGAVAAAAHGAPVSPGGDGPEGGEAAPGFYVQAVADLTRLVQDCGRSHPELAAARAAVAPTPLVVTTAVEAVGEPHPVVHPLFAALDLVGEPGGPALLDRWAPPWIRDGRL